MLSDPVEAVFSGRGKVSVYGLGYVGLSLAAVYLRKGLRVIGVDVNGERLEAIRRGMLGNAEKEVREAVARGLSRGVFELSLDGAKASEESLVKVVTVPVYIDWLSRKPSFNALASAAKSIAEGLKKGDLVIVESSVPPGTTENIVLPILEEKGLRGEDDFYLAYSPERIYVGRAVRDIEENYPKIVGGLGPRSLDAAARFYEGIASRGVYRVSSIRAAEFEKLAEGVYRDVNIALANELALAAMKLGVDFYEAREAANTQPYSHIHLPGPGVGGYCIPVYPYYLMHSLHREGFILDLTRTARRINEAMPSIVVRLAESLWRERKLDPRSSKAAILGAAFRGDIDDTRLSPTRDIAALLRARGFNNIAVHDPYVRADPVLERLGAFITSSMEEALRQAGLIIVSTRHSSYKGLRLSRLLDMAGGEPIVVDSTHYIHVDTPYRWVAVLGKAI